MKNRDVSPSNLQHPYERRFNRRGHEYTGTLWKSYMYACMRLYCLLFLYNSASVTLR